MREFRSGQPSAVPVHGLSHADGVRSAALTDCLHQKLFLVISVPVGVVVVFGFFLQNKLNLFCLNTLFTLIDDPVEIYQLFIIQVIVF